MEIKTLKEIVEEVTYNKDIHDLLTEALQGKPLSPHPYTELVQFQIDQLRKRYNLPAQNIDNNDVKAYLKEEGFQVGEPWDGDIEHSAILMISSNPSFHWDEKSPRYHAESKRLVMPGDGDNNYDHDVSSEEMQNFLYNRIQEPLPDEDSDNMTLEIPLRGRVPGNRREPVRYWGAIRNRIEELLPQSLIIQFDTELKNGKINHKQYARKLMKYVAFMEIVPFRSLEAKGVKAALATCWNDFTQHILARASAPVFMLVGEQPLGEFMSQVFGNSPTVEQHLRNGNICCYQDIGGKERLVVFEPKVQAGPRLFANAFADNPDTLRIIKAIVAYSTSILHN